MNYTFSEQEKDHAYATWGANCGPNALAFALQMPLEAVRSHIPQFENRRYVSPSMMRAALASLGRAFESVSKPAIQDMFSTRVSLVRLQWGGPWIVEGKPQRWAARQTHWICCYYEDRQAEPEMVFDVNGGIRPFTSWREVIVPPLTASVPRCDGTWFPVNVWRLPYPRG